MPDKETPQTCAQQLKVLADPVRLEVMKRLMASGSLHVHELNEGLDIEQSLLSHHLRVLREAGLVLSEREGKGRLYRIASDVQATGRLHPAINLGCCEIVF